MRLAIPNGQTSSNVISGSSLRYAQSLTFYPPATLPEEVKIYVAPTPTGIFVPLQTNDEDIVVAAGKGKTLLVGNFGALKLVAGSAVAAKRSFNVTAGGI